MVYSMEKKLKNTNDLKINFETKEEIDSDCVGKIYNEFSEKDWYKLSNYQFENENREKSKCRGITSLLSFLFILSRLFSRAITHFHAFLQIIKKILF